MIYPPSPLIATKCARLKCSISAMPPLNSAFSLDVPDYTRQRARSVRRRPHRQWPAGRSWFVASKGSVHGLLIRVPDRIRSKDCSAKRPRFRRANNLALNQPDQVVLMRMWYGTGINFVGGVSEVTNRHGDPLVERGDREDLSHLSRHIEIHLVLR